ncbi:hypothetical protein AVEN_134518-1 [Araneus ventricosus]|uniref:Uncharacterized protein n=1 Tax=Araneus ventricosus TaxID=182803 RepID=A0A4Y2J1Q0_ARAVE|nr:hypothetical protein AVEN_134518-1 [Araneus ventricosus]
MEYKKLPRRGSTASPTGSPARPETPLALPLHTKDIHYQNQRYVSDQVDRNGYKSGGMRQFSRSEVPNLYRWGYAKSELVMAEIGKHKELKKKLQNFVSSFFAIY